VFCLQVSVVLPDTINVSEVIKDSLNEDCDYYEVEDIHVSHLINKEFIEAFVKKGTTQLFDNLPIINNFYSELSYINGF
jgi:hypothetical protein